MLHLLLPLLRISLSAAQYHNGDGYDKVRAEINEFSCDLYQTLSKSSSGNFLVGTFAAGTLLGPILSDSIGQRAEELLHALHLKNLIDLDDFNTDIKRKAELFRYNKYYYFFSSNKIYVRNKSLVLDGFEDNFGRGYDEVESINFSKNVKAADAINKWFEKHTYRRIKNVIDPNELNNLTQAVLVNALYFKAQWTTQFVETSKRLNFYKTETDIVKVDYLLHRNGLFKYYKCPEGNVLELGFRGGPFMYILLPGTKKGLKETEEQLKNRWFLPEMDLTSLNVRIPKFKIESIIDLKYFLEKQGVKGLFEKNDADADLHIDHMIQGVYIDVNRDGVEDTAGTSGVRAPTFTDSLTKPIDFVANHPFIFIIKNDGFDIFVGRVTDPSY